MRKFSADYIFTLEGEPIKNGLVTTDSKGKIVSVTHSFNAEEPGIEFHKGIITPGFINTHCHLELSHLKGKIAQGNGLVSFIKEVLTLRDKDEKKVIEAMEMADKAMWEKGIVAVGDISNLSISASVKAKSNIQYHTFVEMVALDPEKANEAFDKALKIKESFEGSVSITPHAPYTLSKTLLKKLYNYCKHHDNIISIHNQENEEENKLYRYKTGEFVKMYEDMGINIDYFTPLSKNPMQALLPLMPEMQNILLVHNTFTSLKDVYLVKRFTKNIFWCFCPGANLYIENTLPNFSFFKHSEALITIGTDSLASNTGLDILEEMKIIHQNDRNISLDNLIQWATINGAKYLGLEGNLGSIKEGKTPGLNLISDLKNDQLTEKSTVTKLI